MAQNCTTRRTIFGTFPDKTVEEIVAETSEPEELEWLEFRGRQYRPRMRVEPRITLGRKGTFFLNTTAYRALGEPVAVELLLDKMRRVIGIKPTDPLKKNAFLVKSHGVNSEYRRISASAFCQHFRVSAPGTLLFNDPEFDADGVLRLDLVNATRVGRGAK